MGPKYIEKINKKERTEIVQTSVFQKLLPSLFVSAFLFTNSCVTGNTPAEFYPETVKGKNTKIEEKNGKVFLSNDSDYTIAEIPFSCESNQTVSIEFYASGQDGAKLGAQIAKIEKEGIIDVKDLCWDSGLNNSGKSFASKFCAEDIKSTRDSEKFIIRFFRSNRIGSVSISDFKLTKTNTQEELKSKLNTLVATGTVTHVPIDDFYAGVYLYDYSLKKYAKEYGLEYDKVTEKTFKTLSSHNINFIYIAISSKESMDTILKYAKKYNIYIIPQIDNFYFNPEWDNATQKAVAVKAAAFIKQYINNPMILAWSVKEEIRPTEVEKLSNYYSLILKDCPGIKFNHQFNNDIAAEVLPDPYPVFSGSIIYAFCFDFSNGGLLFSPIQALRYTKGRTARQYLAAMKRGSNFIPTITSSCYCLPGKARTTCAPDSTDKAAPVLRNLAETGTLGWKKFPRQDGDEYNFWSRYRVPENCMRALLWLSVAEGARGILVWAYAEFPDSMLKERTFEDAASKTNKKKEVVIGTLCPRKDDPRSGYQFEEFSEAIKEVRPYSRIIAKMEKVEASPVWKCDKDIHSSAFKYPGIDGWVIVLVNFDVGTWPLKNKAVFRPGDKIFIDDFGYLQGYVPYKTNRSISFTTKGIENLPIFDLESGNELTPENAFYNSTIKPGGGKFLFAGTREEFQKLMNLKIAVK